MTLKERLEQKFVFVEDVARVLELGYMTGKNVFMYGKGGHAKSEIIKEFLNYIDPHQSSSFIQACGEGLTEEKLFGGIDVAKFHKTGEIEYLVNNSFMNYEYVVFEELLDSRMNVLLSLKDILTSGYFRQGSQLFKIKTKMVICLTNRTKQEVSEDDSIKALLERFPLEVKVEWNSYAESDYTLMFRKVLNNDVTKVAKICSLINENGDFISPRTAVHMAQIYLKTSNISDLKYFGMSNDIVKKMEKEERIVLLTSRIEDISKRSAHIYDDGDISNKDKYHRLNGLLSELNSPSYPDELVNSYRSTKENISSYINTIKDKILNESLS